jgi:transcription elongation factor GreA-like protein
MEAELEKLVEASKLTSKAAEKLNALKPGTFCLHKSWGFGRVAEWNLLLNQIVIDFAGKKGHPMQLQYAAENLEVIPPEHFLARKANDITATKKLAKDDPVALVRNILESRNGRATAQEVSDWMIPDLFNETEWKKWWESARKQMKARGAFSIPVKKTEPIQMRAEGVSQADELIEAFNRARQPKQQLAALEQIIKSHQQFKDPEKQLQPVIAAIENVGARNQKLHPELTF